MESQIAAALIQEASKLLHVGIAALSSRSPSNKTKKTEAPVFEPPPPTWPTPPGVPATPTIIKHTKIAMPNHEETTQELKRRLGRELYKAELDLANGMLIAGKPCDCLDNKHTLQLDACAEELVSQDPDNPVYREIRQWIINNQEKISVEAVASGKYKDEYPHMAFMFKNFRKRVMGSSVDTEPSHRSQPKMLVKRTLTSDEAQKLADHVEARKAAGGSDEITLEQAKKMAAEQAAKEVERQWTNQK